MISAVQRSFQRYIIKGEQTMRHRFFRAAFSVALAVMLLFLSACAQADGNKDSGDNNEKTGIGMNDYTVVYPQNASASLKNSVTLFCGHLGDIASETESVEGRNEIILTESEGTGEHSHEWSVKIEEKRIEIAGTDVDAMRVGMKRFLGMCENGRLNADNGTSLSGGFDDETRVFENLVIMELISTTVIEKPSLKNSSATLKYPTMIELCHQSDESKNGILLASGERWLDDHNCPIYRSDDKGESFETVTYVEDTMHNGTRSAFAPCLFELPRAVGDMPAGTVILGSDCINGDWSEVYVVLFRSYDQGETWETFAEIAGGRTNNGGVWEPNFIVTDDGTLVCYYSEERDPAHSQKLVYRATKDGVNWDDPVDTVALADGGLRPGMPAVTRMADGRYIMAYEIVGMSGNPVYFKYSEDGLDWGDPKEDGTRATASGKKALAATPWISYSPDIGGEKGMLMLTGWRMATGSSDTGSDIFVSFDYGKKWTAIPNFYSYSWSSDNDTWGYSVCTLLSSDGHTIYYMANPQNGRIKNTYTLFKISVE